MKLKTALKTTLATAGVLAGAGSASADSYTIQSGDTLSELSLKFGVSVDDLVHSNKIADANMIFAGSQLEVPTTVSTTEKSATTNVANNGTYTVKAGDTLSAIAATNGMSVSEIASINGIANVHYITVGQVLNLTEATPVHTPEVQAANTVNEAAVVTEPAQQVAVVAPVVEATEAPVATTTTEDAVAPVVVTPVAPSNEAQVTETANTVVENATTVEEPTVAPTVNETPVVTEVVTPTQPVETVNNTTTHTPAPSTPNTYYYGQCTWFVKNNAPWVGNYWGNAADWSRSARAAGFTVDNAPAVGSVVVFQPGQGGAGGYGHVAYVVGVNGSQVTIQEANYNGLLFNQRTINGSGLEYIHNY